MQFYGEPKAPPQSPETCRGRHRTLEKNLQVLGKRCGSHHGDDCGPRPRQSAHKQVEGQVKLQDTNTPVTVMPPSSRTRTCTPLTSLDSHILTNLSDAVHSFLSSEMVTAPEKEQRSFKRLKSRTDPGRTRWDRTETFQDRSGQTDRNQKHITVPITDQKNAENARAAHVWI